MITESQKNIIENNPIALATVAPGNKPNVIAVAYVKVLDKDKILITDNYMKGTVQNLLANKNICLAVWDKDWNGYKLIGSAEYYSNGKWLDYVKKMPENNDCPAKGAILVTIEEIVELA